MTTDTAELLREALELGPSERAELAVSLIDSLDDETESDLERSWGDEIRRRLDELERGEVHAIPWAELRRRLLRQPVPPPMIAQACQNAADGLGRGAVR